MTKPPLLILLCAPRGFCAGVNPRHRRRRAGPVDLRSSGLRPSRDRAQQIRGGILEEEGGHLRRGTRRDPADRCAGDLLRPRRAQGHPDRGQRPQVLRHRRDLPAGDQGPSRGGTAFPPRPHHHPGGPRRPSRSRRHAGPAPRRRRDPGREHRRRASAGGRGLARVPGAEARLRDTDDAVGGRHARHRGDAEAALPRTSSAPTRKTSATPPRTGRTP